MKKLSIIIPAYNEANRITKTLTTYHRYFDQLHADNELDYEIVVVLNGCRDTTAQVVEQIMAQAPKIRLLDLKELAGKGLAVKAGFEDALTRNNDVIGFVDADMATQPQYFYDLFTHLDTADGVIASRYMAGSQVYPQRPWIKTWGRKLVFHGLIRLLFGMKYSDYQCGAKLFTRDVIARVTPEKRVTQWAFDVELLYLCKKYNYQVKAIPTIWYDQDESKLKVMSSGMRMLGSLFYVRMQHSMLRRFLRS